EYFGIGTPGADNVYGGMYINTAGAGGWPFYGYATAGSAHAWTWYDGGTGDWHVHDGGGDRLTVESSGQVGIGTVNPGNMLEVVSTTGDALYAHSNAAFSTGVSGLGLSNGVYGTSNASNGNGVQGVCNGANGTGVRSR